MAIVRRSTDLDATWARAWTADDVADLASVVGTGVEDAHHGDIAYVTATGLYYQFLDDGTWFALQAPDAASAKTVGVTVDGGGAAITTGLKGYVQCPVTGTIDSWTLLADQSGSVVIDVWKDTYANALPTDADSITAAAPPTITTATKATNSTLTGWTTSVTAGDVFGFNVDSATTIERVTLTVVVTP
jgi:hypothetical protein